MKQYLNNILGYATLICCLSGCVSPFEPVGLKDRAGILVVDGMILETGTFVKLSRTVKTEEDLSVANFEDVHDAIIHVIDEEEKIIAVAEKQIIDGKINPGVYVVNHDISFIDGVKYALDMQVAGKKYRSSFVTPVHTPEIDEVSYQINDDYSIDIFVSTHDPENKTNYFRWAFDETWEIRSYLFQAFRYDTIKETFSIPQYLWGENTHYCWKSDYSNSLVLASSAKLSDVLIKNHKIHTLKPGNSRYSYLYSILVKQYGLDNDAYLYFENLHRNMDESGSLFAPQPTEIASNIQCLSNPDETVIGYIFASKVTTSRLFIPMERLDLYFYEDRYDCYKPLGLKPYNEEMAFNLGYGLYFGEDKRYVSMTCLDCTQRGGTKTKPDYWPNDHQ